MFPLSQRVKIVINALEDGRVVEVGNIGKIGMTEDGLIGLLFGEDKVVTGGLSGEIGINRFLTELSKMKEEEFVILAGNNVLQSIHRKKDADKSVDKRQ